MLRYWLAHVVARQSYSGAVEIAAHACLTLLDNRARSVVVHFIWAIPGVKGWLGMVIKRSDMDEFEVKGYLSTGWWHGGSNYVWGSTHGQGTQVIYHRALLLFFEFWEILCCTG